MAAENEMPEVNGAEVTAPTSIRFQNDLPEELKERIKAEAAGRSAEQEGNCDWHRRKNRTVPGHVDPYIFNGHGSSSTGPGSQFGMALEIDMIKNIADMAQHLAGK